ncbi:MAG: hypothetical protein ACIARR_03135 [Phycisphaerales bacterium JB059]
MNLRWILFGVLGLTTLAQAQAPSSPRDLADRAAQLVSESERLRAEEPEESDRLLDEAARIYQRLSDDRSVRSAELERSLGGSLLMLGETGRGVLHLRRAERLDPTDRATRETLAYARDQVRSGVAPSVGSRVRAVALWWRGHVPRNLVLSGALGSWVLAWSIAILRRLRGWHGGGVVIGTLLGTSVLGGALLGSEYWLDRVSREGVLVEDGVLARNGPSEAVYPPTFTEPMRAGVELRVLERREGWTRVELRNGQETWVPADAVELVTPAPSS